MYEVRAEVPGEQVRIIRNLERGQAALKAKELGEAWVKKGGGVKIHQMDMDGSLVLHLTKDDSKVGQVSAYEQASTEKVTGKYKDLQKLMRMHLGPKELASAVTDIVTEIQEGRWPSSEQATLVFTVGELRAVPGFWMSKILIRDVAAAYVGRFVRKSAGFAGLDVNNQEVMMRILPLLETTNQAEKDCIKYVQGAMTKKFGLADFDAAKLQDLEAKMLKALPGLDQDL